MIISKTRKLRLEVCNTKSRLKILLDDEIVQLVHSYDPQNFGNFTEIASGGSALVYNVYWKSTSRFAIKKYKSFNKEAIINEIYLTGMVNPHQNIIQFYGVTKLKDEMNYSLVLEYADGGTLRNYLRNTITFEWDIQLRFSKEIASAISWLHDDKEIIHGDLHPNNILIHKDTIKLADFGRSCQKGSVSHTEVSIIWELTSRLSPFDFENKDKLEIIQVKQDILNGNREIPIQNTNNKFVSLYKECWRHNPDERPSICKVIEVLDSINPIDLVVPKNNNVSTNLNSNKSESTEDSDLPSCEEYDINSDRYNI
ncbi:unnamed protein product [Rhizophagus irregularis]|uniref:Protein kinase domain-containing protein n=1 Tax=Rhizophagus irregularis TaxID=588596 RepID=A0A915ZRJ1_9GLOM|nr:unnamed protein product [Rhizophagus irregularis]CAB5388440.1 unnamed protein product [Rhizophagus irregularis]